MTTAPLLLPLDHPRTFRRLAVVGLLVLALFGGFAAVQESARYPAAVALFCLMVLFRKWQEPYVLAGAVSLFVFAGSLLPVLQEKGTTYRWHGLFLLVGVGALRTVYESRWHVQLRPLFVGMLVWFGYIVMSTLWAWDISYSLPRAVAVGAVGAAVFFSLWRYLEGWPQLALVLKSLVAALLPIALLQFLGPSGGPEVGYRFAGVMNHVNSLGLLTMVIAPLGLYVLLDAPVRAAFRVAGGALAASGLVLLVLCASRSAVVGVGLGVGLYVVCRNPVKLLLAVAACALVVGILIGYEVDVLEVFHLERLIRPESLPTGTNRTTAWWIGWLQHKESPVWGFGFASSMFLLVGSSFSPLMRILGIGRFHNTYIELLVDTGWMGALPFFLFLLYLAARGARALKMHWGSLLYRRAVLGLGAVVVAGLAHAFFESWLFSTGGPVTLLWWALMACWMKVVLEPARFLEEPAQARAT